ncbi:MAG TPA: FecR family protein, partial [Smithellaceae bacterium]|nr:FecR family protein [Smithellaceae bacterium]
MRAKLTSLLMILCLLMVFAAVVQAAPAGKVTNLEGRADLTVTGQPAKALFIGDTVNVGDILRTKSGSKLEVTWIDGSIARLSENSRLKVTEFTLGAQKRSTILSLFRGKVQNIVTGTTKLFGAKDGSRYEVHTPTSVCGVRGTIFFTYHENGISGALFTEGKGFMYSKGQPSNVKPVAPGVLMIVTSANKPPEAKPAKPGDATKLFNATNPSEKKKDDKKGEDKKEGAAGEGTSKSDSGTTASSGKDESKGGTKTEDTGSTTTSTSTTTTSGTTGTGDTASGTTGTGGTTTMLGGDPTATLGTAAPGTLAAKIEAGTVADTPGTSSPLTNPTNPVTP